MACCVLHTWCLTEDDDDESAFEAFAEELETDVNSEEAIAGTQRNSSGGVTKRDILCDIIRKLP